MMQQHMRYRENEGDSAIEEQGGRFETGEDKEQFTKVQPRSRDSLVPRVEVEAAVFNSVDCLPSVRFSRWGLLRTDPNLPHALRQT